MSTRSIEAAKINAIINMLFSCLNNAKFGIRTFYWAGTHFGLFADVKSARQREKVRHVLSSPLVVTQSKSAAPQQRSLSVAAFK